ncbi:hypothetical protein PQX77_002601 [Marasmius sp. AFHP31]|nr:hypothetical protein PQX77_002601 [Marasmius sp. AFHP31]
MDAKTKTNTRVKIRVCRPSDQDAIQKLFKDCIVFSAGSPARVALSDAFTSHTVYGCYLLLAISISFVAMTLRSSSSSPSSSPTLATTTSSYLANMITFYTAISAILLTTLYLAILFHGRTSLYVNFAYSSCKDDLSKIVDHYELKRIADGGMEGMGGEGEWEYETTGPKGFWVAEIGEEVVGCVGLDISSLHGPPHGEMRRMVVSPHHRRLGIAQKLNAVFEAHARKYALESIVLTTTEFQPGPRVLYEKNGYFVDSTKLMPSGVMWVRFYFYRKWLGDVEK